MGKKISAIAHSSDVKGFSILLKADILSKFPQYNLHMPFHGWINGYRHDGMFWPPPSDSVDKLHWMSIPDTLAERAEIKVGSIVVIEFKERTKRKSGAA